MVYGGLGAQMDMFDQMPNLHTLTWLIHQLETYFSSTLPRKYLQ
jgi:hypothetical protein